MKKSATGFTLVEMLVVLALGAILTVLAVPSFQTLLLNRRVQVAVDALAGDLRFARGEAIKRSARVTICASLDGASCQGAGGLWKNGWIVFVPTAASGSFTAGDEIVRVQGAMSSIDSIAAANGTTLPQFIYEPTGWAKAAAQTFIVTPSGSASSRTLCVSNQGRPAIRAEGVTSCS
jgi:type IV fimbrial biogenesis protein FimT